MNYSDFFDPNEKPLERLLPDGGFCGIFRTIGCIGDSLSSGEFQTRRSEDAFRYTDMFEYSWGQFMARTIGSKVYNFSKGGMTAKNYVTKFAEEKGFWDPELACQAYIIALGVAAGFVTIVPRQVESLDNWVQHFAVIEDVIIDNWLAAEKRDKRIKN